MCSVIIHPLASEEQNLVQKTNRSERLVSLVIKPGKFLRDTVVFLTFGAFFFVFAFC